MLNYSIAFIHTLSMLPFTINPNVNLLQHGTVSKLHWAVNLMQSRTQGTHPQPSEPSSSSSLTLFAPNATIALDLSPLNYHSHTNVHGALIGGKKKTIPAGIYPYVECKIGKLYDQRHGVKSHTHVVFDVVDIAFCEPSCLSFCFSWDRWVGRWDKIPAVRQTATEEIFFNMFLKQNV